jgi:hypothetical protein
VVERLGGELSLSSRIFGLLISLTHAAQCVLGLEDAGGCVPRFAE